MDTSRRSKDPSTLCDSTLILYWKKLALNFYHGFGTLKTKSGGRRISLGGDFVLSVPMLF